VYYEDTDAGGVVYHSNYLKFMERARTEWLAHMGLELPWMERELALMFVVRRASVEFLKPARLSDTIEVDVEVKALKGTTIIFTQRIRRGEELLITGEVTVVAISATSFKPCGFPALVRERLTQFCLND
jgi:acyl-CoA thioester hydrolase